MTVLELQGAATGLLTERTVGWRRRDRHVEAAQPGDLCCLDTFYVGKLNGVRRVWQITACYAASSYGCARVVVGEVTVALVVAFVLQVVLPRYRAAGWTLRRVLTDSGKGFKGGFGAACARRGIRPPA